MKVLRAQAFLRRSDHGRAGGSRRCPARSPGDRRPPTLMWRPSSKHSSGTGRSYKGSGFRRPDCHEWDWYGHGL